MKGGPAGYEYQCRFRFKEMRRKIQSGVPIEVGIDYLFLHKNLQCFATLTMLLAIPLCLAAVPGKQGGSSPCFGTNDARPTDFQVLHRWSGENVIKKKERKDRKRSDYNNRYE